MGARRPAPGHDLDVVLHLGDLIYVVKYPDEVATRRGRTIVGIGSVLKTRWIGDFHVPTDLGGYGTTYRATGISRTRASD